MWARTSESFLVAGNVVVAADGTIFTFGSVANTTVALSPKDGSTLWTYTAGGAVCNPEAVPTALVHSICCLVASLVGSAAGSVLDRLRIGPGADG